MKPEIRNLKTDGYWPLEGEVLLPLFGKFVRFSSDDADGIDYVEQCAAYVNNLDERLIQALCEASIRYCNDFLDVTGQEPMKFDTPRDVLRRVSPNMLIIPDEEIPGTPVFHMELNCEWEIEHGMEWIVRDSRVLYVGAFNGGDPWDEYLEKDSWNFA